MHKTDFKAGDRVVCMMHGEGVVERLSTSGLFVVNVVFDSRVRTYTSGGRYETDSNRTLYHANSGIVEFDTTCHPDIEPGQVIWVNDGLAWFVRHFSHFKNGKAFCFVSGQIEGDVTFWKHYSLTKPEASHAK